MCLIKLCINGIKCVIVRIIIKIRTKKYTVKNFNLIIGKLIKKKHFNIKNNNNNNLLLINFNIEIANSTKKS